MPALTIFGDGSPPSSGLKQSLYRRNIEDTAPASSARLGTASRSAAAGRRYAIVASAKSETDKGQGYDLTGVFRITGGRERPYEWIAQFETYDTVQELPAGCGQFFAIEN